MGGRVDGRADLYALGCVLYALLAGRPPFRGPTPVATMLMHGQDPVPDVRGLRPETPDWLADLVHGLLAKDPADQPAGAASVAEALAARESVRGMATAVLPAAGAAAATAVGRTASAPAPHPAALPVDPDPRDERRDRSALTWLLGLVALAALGLLAWQVFGVGTTRGRRRRTRRPPRPPRRPRRRASRLRRRHPPPRRRPPSTTRPSPTPTANPADAVAASLSTFSDEVDSLQRDGVIDNDTAKTLDDRVRDIQQALRDDEVEKVVDERDKLVEEYDKAVGEGNISTDAAQRLDPLLADVTDSVDAYAG